MAVVDTFRIDPPPPFTRRALVVLLVVFALTRAAGAYVVLRPDGWGPAQTSVSLDFSFYYDRAESVTGGSTPYSEQNLEYPPGSLALIVAPSLGGMDEVGYRFAFVAILLALDVAGLLGLLRLAGRWGSRWGPWMWVILIAILGPLTYARLDLLPAVMTIWVLERAAAGAWRASGVWLGAAIFTKIYPILLLPVAVVIAAKRRKLVEGVAWGALLPMIPFTLLLPEMIEDVLGYHTDRGIQIESIYGSGFLVAMRRGASYLIDADFGAYHFNGQVIQTLKSVSSLLTVFALGAGVYFAHRRAKRGSAEDMAQIMFATLAATLAVSTVFSPQYVIWVIALAAAATCSRRSPMLLPALALIPVAALTQAVFPFLYPGILSVEATPLFTLWFRNILVLGTAGAALALIHSRLAGDRAAAPSPAG